MATEAQTHENAVETAMASSYGIDLVELRAKYAFERQKRLNPRKNEQFIEVTGDFSHYIDDPYTTEPLVRESVVEVVDAVVIGGGFGGLLAGSKLRDAGIDNFRIIEKAADFGGTWYWNRYPGAQCDIESYIYMPLLEETGYIPTEKYAYAGELFEHAKRIGRTFDLYKAALFQTQITQLRWNEEQHRWDVATDRGDQISARFVLSASGPLNRPRLPGIPGIASFRGHTFHTSRWDYGYTGGHSRGEMVGLNDKHVAVIGTGATAIQCVPYVAQDAARLYVVQRTPSTVDVRGNRPTDPAWASTLQPGWQRARMDNFIATLNGVNDGPDLVDDGWTHLAYDTVNSLRKPDGSAFSPEEMAIAMEIADFRKGDDIRARIDRIVQDPAKAESLKPWYGMVCKRPTFNDEYLDAFNRDNVSLIDTQGRGPDRITESAIVFDGVEYPVDCIIFATGFETGTAYSRRAAFEIYGVDGLSLTQKFANGTSTLYGLATSGFPNFFMMALGQNGFKPNISDTLEEQARHIVEIVKSTLDQSKTRVEVEETAEKAWVAHVLDLAKIKLPYFEACTPGYYTGEGDIDKGLLIDTYAPGPIEFTKVIDAWRNDGRPGLVID
ncbi:flavin-containing monooxygenase [Novosphingobium cyanobacteriorum]|uniref:NAD(P)/FAD-dependent oxidoreductase n=1 Tax=Novosphingobium cyanobacteriorum TaxID=3024215 RepID=A0ABT6CIQ3_9SPHN|nr:NAD(P)/FAD-dependent oxidoreductase [Novosphingobium cyanobacteriorum]MDF8333808.1 NAD(P)/FAD-dependent oxidoreductase [Novosphingobium cyanobacteriorum]